MITPSPDFVADNIKSAHKAQGITHPTALQFTLPNEQKPTINQLYAAVASDDVRNQQIIADVQKCLQEKRNPLILTERKDHAALLTEKLLPFCKNVVVLVGGQAAKNALKLPNNLHPFLMMKNA